ncbi:MAG: nitroreductase family protein [Candidatus Omnitrophica bacterium]|nr:nitroreductase family protein [Candidatus Omnitrophota bacterium]
MNEILSNIKTRRSRREFIDKNIPEDEITRIIEAGRYAPSALNKQPWRFVIITNKETIRRLSEIVKTVSKKILRFLPLLQIIKSSLRDEKVVAAIKKSATAASDAVFFDAPLLILLLADGKEMYAAKDCAIASQNMMLYAHSIGISSCYIGRADLLDLSRKARKIIGMAPKMKIQAAVIFGYSPGITGAKIVERRTDNIIGWIK